MHATKGNLSSPQVCPGHLVLGRSGEPVMSWRRLHHLSNPGTVIGRLRVKSVVHYSLRHCLPSFCFSSVTAESSLAATNLKLVFS